MGMTGGTVSVNQSTGSYSGTGLAKALMDAYFPVLQAKFTAGQLAYVNPLTGNPEFAIGVANSAAELANAFGPAIVAYIQANASAHVTSQVLGRMPSSTAQDTPIEAPASPVDIPIT